MHAMSLPKHSMLYSRGSCDGSTSASCACPLHTHTAKPATLCKLSLPPASCELPPASCLRLLPLLAMFGPQQAKLLLAIVVVVVALVVVPIHLKPANCDFRLNYVYALRSTAIKVAPQPPARQPTFGSLKRQQQMGKGVRATTKMVR